MGAALIDRSKWNPTMLAICLFLSFPLAQVLFMPLAQALPQAMTFQEVVDFAYQNNAEIISNRDLLKAAQAQQKAALQGFFPQVTANLGYNHGTSSAPQNVSVFGSSATSPSSQTSYSASLNATQNLFAGFSDYARWKSATFNSQVSAAQLRLTMARTAYDLVSAYENLRYAQDYKKLATTIIKRRKDNMGLVQLRFQSGRENKGSSLLSEAYHNQAELDLLLAENLERVSRVQLLRSMGADEGESLTVNEAAPFEEPILYTDRELKSFVTDVPEYQTASAQERAANYQITSASSLFYPQLSLNGSILRSDDSFFPVENKRWAVGATLSWALFNGGRDYYARSAAQSQWASAEALRDHSLRVVWAKIELNYAQYREAAQRFRVDSSFKDAVTVRAEIARKKYNNGLLTFEDWDVIENDLIARQKQYLQSQRDRVLAYAAWNQSLGRHLWDR